MSIPKHPSYEYFERDAWKTNHYVCGIDEVGRGCLAGPLITAAAILPIHTSHPLLKDSKVLSSLQRTKAATFIKSSCWVATAIVDHRDIDEHNVYKATRYAMKKAFLHLLATLPFSSHHIKHVVVDAVPLFLEKILLESTHVHTITKAESCSPSVAAASIVAKVTRDNLMQKIGSFFPAYHFESHKGYGTSTHTQAIKNHNISIIHRRSFTPCSRMSTRKDRREKQQTIV